jgi:hypothetical protein
MKWKSVNAVRRDPPLVERQVFGGGFFVSLHVVVLDGLQMFFQEFDDVIVWHVISSDGEISGQ